MAEFVAGRRGEDVRSDCWVAFTPAESGGLECDVFSKVESMYGEAIRGDARQALQTMGIEHGRLTIEDAGALPFVLLSRIETAVRRYRPSAPPLLPELSPGAVRATTRERFRRSRLYLPGNQAKFMLNAALHRPDGLILDLEDSVAPAEKDAARCLVRNALRALDFGSCERMVRINQLPLGLRDLEEIIPHNVHLVLIPKCESAEEVVEVARKIEEIQAHAGRETPRGTGTPGPDGTAPPVLLMPILESALGVLRAHEIAMASPSVAALTIGLEDYTADLGAQRTREGRESFFARSMVVNAARAAGVQAIDSVFSDVADMEGLLASVQEAKALGFEGKGCIHPRQIPVVHQGFAPTDEELEKARAIVDAFREAEGRGEAVVALGSKMIDPPVVKRALRILRLVEPSGSVEVKP